MTTTNAAEQGNLIATKTICLCLERGKFGNSKKAGLSAVTVRADKTRLRMSKQLIDSPELTNISKLDTEVSIYLSALASPSLMKGGIYMVPIAGVSALEAALKGFQTRRQALVEIAVEKFDQRVQETIEPLGDVYDASDYPTAEAFRDTFKFSWRYVTFDTPQRLKAISSELFESEREKHAAHLSSVADSCRDAMRTGLADLVKHLVDKLTPGADGKKKVFSKSAVESMNEFLASFDMRNVTEDSELSALVVRARAAISGVDAPMLRTNDEVRTTVLDQFSGLADSLEVLTAQRGDRKIEFETED